MGSQGNPIKVMVTGASGMLGRSLCRCLAQYPDDFVVVPLGFSRAVPPMRKVDLTDTAALRTLFSEVQPDVLVHTAAERDPDRAAKDPTRLDHLNVRAPFILAEECAKCGAHLAYISTDYVFDGGISTGSYPPYSPDAPTAPVNVCMRMAANSQARMHACVNTWTHMRVQLRPHMRAPLPIPLRTRAHLRTMRVR